MEHHAPNTICLSRRGHDPLSLAIDVELALAALDRWPVGRLARLRASRLLPPRARAGSKSIASGNGS